MGDGGGRRGHHRTGRRGGRTGLNSGSSNDGGIFTTGFHTDSADFGNQYSAQNLQPTYGQQQPQYGAGGQSQYQGGRGGGGGQAQYGGGGGGGQAQYGGGAADDNIAMLEKAVPGIPGQDYPIYSEVPETSFSCAGQVDGGYYGDPQAECQVFHICTNDGQGGLSKYSFLCPNGTIFNQEYFICDWWFNFDCSEAEAFYSLNEEIAAEREAATQALLSAASNGQATYLSQSSSNSYASPSSSSSASSGGYSAPSSGSYSSPNGGGGSNRGRQGGNGRRKNNNRGKKGGQSRRRPASSGNSRRNNNSYSASPVSQNYGAPSQSPSSGYSSAAASTGQAASSGYGGPTSQAASPNYAAPASNGYGSPSASSYGSPDYSDDLPSYGRKK